jgi:hypothetical protein
MKARKLIEDLINTREFQKFCDSFCHIGVKDAGMIASFSGSETG